MKNGDWKKFVEGVGRIGVGGGGGGGRDRDRQTDRERENCGCLLARLSV